MRRFHDECPDDSPVFNKNLFKCDYCGVIYDKRTNKEIDGSEYGLNGICRKCMIAIDTSCEALSL